MISTVTWLGSPILLGVRHLWFVISTLTLIVQDQCPQWQWPIHRQVNLLQKQCVSFSVATKYGARNCNNNDKDSTADFCSNNRLPRDCDTLSSDDKLLKSVAFPQHSFMAKYIHEYAAMKGFLPVDKRKEYFTSKEFSESFTIKSHDHSLESNINQNKKHSRRGYYCCSSKSHGRIKGTECCFCLSYFWDARNSWFVFSSKGSNLSHNHQLSSQSRLHVTAVILSITE